MMVELLKVFFYFLFGQLGRYWGFCYVNAYKLFINSLNAVML